MIRRQVTRLLKRFERKFETYNRIEISRTAIRHNLNVMKSVAIGEPKIIPVLKANAYGHGIKEVARALVGSGVPYVAVDGYFEALRVREVSKLPVLIMGAIKPQNFAKLNYDKFAFVVGDADTIRAIGKTGKRVKVHLECNTGMNRHGARPDEVSWLTQLILSYKNLQLEGVMSHLATSDGSDQQTVTEAVKLFDACVDVVQQTGAQPSLIHVAQTAGSVRAHSQYANAVRVGMGLYGINPFGHHHPLYHRLSDLRPTLKFVSTITKVNTLQKGDSVSYGYTYTAPKLLEVGVIPVGYYEGIDVALSNTGVVKIDKKFAPIIGRVNMNHTIISLDDVPAKVGTEVVIYSNEPHDPNAIQNIAEAHGLFSYSLLTHLSPDTKRVLVE